MTQGPFAQTRSVSRRDGRLLAGIATASTTAAMVSTLGQSQVVGAEGRLAVADDRRVPEEICDA